jgi:hypothetical protein
LLCVLDATKKYEIKAASQEKNAAACLPAGPSAAV